jgi:decaprenyl-phosphate phosphoribosyltransferase
MNSVEAFATRAETALAQPERKAGMGGAARALLSACRPRQWVKNVLVLAAPAAAGVLGRPGAIAEAAAAFGAFSLLASATYLVNDVRDRHEDRRHATKRLRAVADGRLSPRQALAAAAALAIAGLSLAAVDGLGFVAVALGYLALTISYTYLWRQRPVFDVLAVAGGFVVRAGAGAVAVHVGLSRWFLLVACFGALFIVSGKRYAELRRTAGAPKRLVLSRYSAAGLRALIGASLVAVWVSYCLWALDRPTEHALVWGALTVVPFSLWLGRYAQMLAGGAGEAPEELVLGDAPLIALSACWAALFAVGIYVG